MAPVIAFQPARDPRPSPASDSPLWRRLLLASAAVAAFATTQPWVRVQFARLWGVHVGPPGWQSSAGFTCFCTCALVAILTLSETASRATQQAVRPASLLLVVISMLALVFECWDGPGHVRGLTAVWTYAFWLLCGSLPALLWACTRRCAATGSRPITGLP